MPVLVPVIFVQSTAAMTSQTGHKGITAQASSHFVSLALQAIPSRSSSLGVSDATLMSAVSIVRWISIVKRHHGSSRWDWNIITDKLCNISDKKDELHSALASPCFSLWVSRSFLLEFMTNCGRVSAEVPPSDNAVVEKPPSFLLSH